MTPDTTFAPLSVVPAQSVATLARPDWPGVSLAPGQGQAEGGPALRARVRASKNGLGPARPDPWTV